MAEVIITHDDGEPVVVLKFGGTAFGQCTLFLKAPGSGSWRSLTPKFTSEDQAEHQFTLDSAAQGVGNSLEDFNGYKFGWTVTFIGFDEDDESQYSFDLGIFQNGGAILKPAYHKEGTFTTPSKTFATQVEFKVQ